MIFDYTVERWELLERKGFMSIFSDRLREVRTKRGLNQSQLAEKLGITQPQLSNYERSTSPKPETIAKMVLILEVSADYLLGLTDDPMPLSRDERELIRLRRAGLDKRSDAEIGLDAINDVALNKPNLDTPRK